MNKANLRGFRHLALANWRELIRDPKTLLYILMPPVLIYGMFVFMTTITTRSQPVVVVVPPVADAGVQRVVGALEALPKITVGVVDPLNADQVKASGRYEALVYMPVSLESGSIRVEGAPRTKVSLGMLQKVLTQATRTAGRPAVQVERRGSAEVDPVTFGLPGVLVYALASLALFGIATSIVQLRQRGTLRLLGTTPVTRLTFVLAQVPARLGLATVAAVIVLTGIHIQSDVPVLALLAALGTAMLGFLMMASVGYLVGGTFTSTEAATNLLSFLLPVGLMASGVLMPLDVFPGWVGTFSRAIPVTYLGDALRQELGVGSTALAPVWVDLAMVLTTTVLVTCLAARFFRWDQAEAGTVASSQSDGDHEVLEET